MVCLWETGEFSRRKGCGRLTNLCFGQRQEIMSWLLYDVIMMSLPSKLPSGDETSSEEREFTLF